MMKCGICADLAVSHHRTSVQQLLAAAKRGCNGCSLLLRILQSFPELYRKTVDIAWTVERSLHVTLLAGREKEIGALEVFVDSGSQSPWLAIGAGRTVRPEVWSQQQIRLVREWLGDCTSKHSICPRPEATPLPTRVVDVGSSDGEIKLRSSSGESAPYVALSHCWGGHIPIQTTKKSLRDHFGAIPLNSSSQTFLDAAQVCRDLRIKYLWIDSLCIVQDDDEDWAAEAGRMSEVYRNASLTISAEAAKTAKDGLFKNTRSSVHKQVDTDWTACSGSHAKVHVRLRGAGAQSQGIIGNFAHASSAVSRSELSERAWVLQERLLSSRILHFFSEELAWSCCSVSRCECRIDPDITDTSIFKRLNIESYPRDRVVEELHREWTNLVVEFTSRELTKIKDRLPAISGLAKLCGDVTSSKYYAGLFQYDLEYGLLWMSDYHAASFLIYRNPDRPSMPTWSWASTNGPVKYFSRHRNQFERRTGQTTVIPLFKVLETEVNLRGPDVYTDADRGLVKIKGQLLRVRRDITTCHFQPFDDALANQMIPKDIPFDPKDQQSPEKTIDEFSHMIPGPRPTTDQVIDIPQKAKTRQPQIIPDVLAEPTESKRSNELYLLRAARYIPGGIHAYESSENLCLLLEREDVEGGLVVFKRRAVVMYGFPSRPFWEEGNAPTRVFGIV